MVADFNNGGEADGQDRSLGNQDHFDLSLVTNDSARLHIEKDGNIGIGTVTPQEQLEIMGNLRIPASTDSTGVIKQGASNFIHSYGSQSTFIGINSGNLSHSGSGNTGIGESALSNLSTGTRNTALGAFALEANSVGLDNVALSLIHI